MIEDFVTCEAPFLHERGGWCVSFKWRDQEPDYPHERRWRQDSLAQWCNENLVGKAVIYGDCIFRFSHEEDAVLAYLKFR